MNGYISAPLFAGSLLVGMLFFVDLGRRLGRRRLARDGTLPGFGAVESSVFALFGLLIAFTFSGAASHYDSRRTLIADEANAIGTAYLRLDLLPTEDQPAARQLFRDHLDSRLDVYRKLSDLDAAFAELTRSAGIQQAIWERCLPATTRPGAHPNAAILLIPALNEMFDITTTRTMAARAHPPNLIYYLLFALGLASALLAGFSMAGAKGWSWLHALAFATFIAATTYVILEIEYPRYGLIRLAEFDDVLVDLRASMK